MIWHCSTALNIDTGVEMTVLPNARTSLVGVILNGTTLKSGSALLLNYHFKFCQWHSGTAMSLSEALLRKYGNFPVSEGGEEGMQIQSKSGSNNHFMQSHSAHTDQHEWRDFSTSLHKYMSIHQIPHAAATSVATVAFNIFIDLQSFDLENTLTATLCSKNQKLFSSLSLLWSFKECNTLFPCPFLKEASLQWCFSTAQQQWPVKKGSKCFCIYLLLIYLLCTGCKSKRRNINSLQHIASPKKDSSITFPPKKLPFQNITQANESLYSYTTASEIMSCYWSIKKLQSRDQKLKEMERLSPQSYSQITMLQHNSNLVFKLFRELFPQQILWSIWLGVKRLYVKFLEKEHCITKDSYHFSISIFLWAMPNEINH